MWIRKGRIGHREEASRLQVSRSNSTRMATLPTLIKGQIIGGRDSRSSVPSSWAPTRYSQRFGGPRVRVEVISAPPIRAALLFEQDLALLLPGGCAGLPTCHAARRSLPFVRVIRANWLLAVSTHDGISSAGTMAGLAQPSIG